MQTSVPDIIGIRSYIKMKDKRNLNTISGTESCCFRWFWKALYRSERTLHYCFIFETILSWFLANFLSTLELFENDLTYNPNGSFLFCFFLQGNMANSVWKFVKSAWEYNRMILYAKYAWQIAVRGVKRWRDDLPTRLDILF